MNQSIKKASGEIEQFDANKLKKSFERAGVPADIAEESTAQVFRELSTNPNTDEIYQKSLVHLRSKHALGALRYGLKRAVMNLGPAGYRFEKYVAKLLEAKGYQTQTGKIVQGYCVGHEVDVLAKKDDRHLMIECKLHHDPGARSDVKVALYTFARFQDVKEGFEKHQEKSQLVHEAWLVTNTKCTIDAIRFARCRNLNVLAWRYPHDQGLEQLIEETKLYPVTILPSMHPAVLERLSSENLILVGELLKYPVEQLAKEFNLKPETAQSLINESNELTDKVEVYSNQETE